MTIPKGIVGGFEFTVHQRILREWHERPWTCLRVLKKSNKRRFDSYSVRNNVLIISLLPFRIVACVFFLTAFLEIPVILLGGSLHGKVATAVTSHQCSPSVSHSIHTVLWYFVILLSRRFRLIARFPYAMEKMYVLCSASTQNKTSW